MIAKKIIKAYDEAIGILKDLRALALHKQRGEEFMGQVEKIRARYPRVLGLKRRMEEAKLIE